MMTFRTQSEVWLAEQESRNIKPSSLRSYRSILNVHLYPRFADQPLEQLALINNKALRQLVADLKRNYKPATIRIAAQTFKAVLDSPVDDNGVRMFCCEWNNDFANLPAVNPLEQRAPVITNKEIEHVVATHRDQLLFGILGGTGARISEILALTGKEWDRDAGILFIRQAKSPAGVREIDLPWELNIWLRDGLGDVAPDRRLFPGSLTSYRTRARGVTGFAHSFRRFRLTWLRKVGAPEDLLRAWLGHNEKSISDRYSKLKVDRAYRREQCQRAGLGFELPESEVSAQAAD